MSEITITPLGTISPYTKGNMNCPGVLINYNNKKILLDCGSGITRLLKFPDTLEDLLIIIEIISEISEVSATHLMSIII